MISEQEAAAEAARAAGAEMAEFEVINGALVINDEPFAVGSTVRLPRADGEVLIGVGRLAEPSAKAPSHGLNVGQLKDALTAKSIAFPADAKKAELAQLLDNAPVEGTESAE